MRHPDPLPAGGRTVIDARSAPHAGALSPIRALLVDDEPLARLRLRTLLADHRDVTVVGECVDGTEARAAIAMLHPDVVFLDVEMAEVSGVDVAREHHASSSAPAIVFVTAYARYAVEAFAVEALDYLLKPFDEARLAATLQRVRAHRTAMELQEAHASLLGTLRELSRGGTPLRATLGPSPASWVRVGEISVDLRARIARRGERVLALRPKEFDLLAALLRRAGEVMTRRELLLEVWGYLEGVESRTIDTHVSALRRKLGASPGEPGFIAGVAGAGYRLTT